MAPPHLPEPTYDSMLMAPPNAPEPRSLMGTRVTQAGRGLMEADRDLPPPTLSDALWLAVVVLGVADCFGLAPGLHH